MSYINIIINMGFWNNYKSTLPGHNTYTHFSRKMRWSISCLWSGKWPEFDENSARSREDSDEMWLAKDMVWPADGLIGVLFALQSLPLLKETLVIIN